MKNQCKFEIAWVGRCKEPADESGYCEKHKSLVCVNCGAQATRECPETMGFVCGYPLCDECEHTIQSNGCNSGGELPKGLSAHCKKTEQVYKPWYARENEDDIFIIDKEEEHICDDCKDRNCKNK